MSLRSFSFGSYMGVEEVPEEVVSLFNGCLEDGKQLHYASEIIFAGIQGRIDLNNSFNVVGYEKVIDKNTSLVMRKRKKKEMYIDYGSSDDYETVAQNGGIQADRLYIEDVQDAFEELVDNDELRFAVDNIKKLNSEFIIVEELDLIEAIRLALKGIPQAIKDIKRICDFYPKVADSIKTVLSSGVEFETVFA